MLTAESMTALSFPVYDQRYKSDPASPFRLYDCLIPAMKQHQRVPVALLPKGYDTDLRLQMDYKRAREAVKLLQTKKLQQENWQLKGKVLQLEAQIEVIDWYIKFELDGRTPKQILQDYYKAIADCNSLNAELN